MAHMSAQARESIVLQALNRTVGTSIESIANLNNIGLSTLQRWLKNYRAGLPLGHKRHNGGSTSSKLSREQQFSHILATDKLDDVSLGKYCREHGIYSHQLTQWREELMASDDSRDKKQNQSELKALKEENKRLQKELRRKEKALAEASALLILKKKADLIWGENEDD